MDSSVSLLKYKRSTRVITALDEHEINISSSITSPRTWNSLSFPNISKLWESLYHESWIRPPADVLSLGRHWLWPLPLPQKLRSKRKLLHNSSRFLPDPQLPDDASHVLPTFDQRSSSLESILGSTGIKVDHSSEGDIQSIQFGRGEKRN